ncbi:MAG: peptide/nickel transport system substrate-binding protein [Actinomycetota bacterium]|nr:peptide/nickel transport system substrate-binding protein [Actinomycetota bacterium]
MRALGSWRIRLAAMTVVLAAVASACSGSTSSGGSGDTSAGGETGGTLKIAMSAGNIPIPDVSPDQGAEGQRFVANNIYDSLTRLNLDQDKTLPTPQPALAQSWEVSPDQLTWTFHLRTDVKFHDDTPFNADSVIFNFNRFTKPDFQFYEKTIAARQSARFKYFASYAKIDDSTVTITTTQPYSMLLNDLLTLNMASPTAVQTYGNQGYLQHATGTGPFKMTKYIDGQVMELTANKSYWRGAPKLDKIILTPQPEPASRLASLQSGDANWAEVPAPDALSQLKSQGFQIFMNDKHPGAIMPQFNFYRGPTTDLRVRQALNYAVDRQGTVNLIDGTGVPASQYVYPGHPNFIPNYPGFSYDPAKAKALLADAGYGPGGQKLSLRFIYTVNGSGNMFPGPMMEKLQADFKAVGVDVTLVPTEWNTFITIRTVGGLKSPQYADNDIIWASPAAGMLPIGYVQSFTCAAGGVPNIGGYCSPAVDALYDQAAQTFDLAKQNQLLTQMLKVAEDDAAFLYWVQDRNLRVMAPTVHGYVQAQSWWVDFTLLSVSSGN